MSVRRSAGAMFWAMSLVAIGMLLLAHNLGYSIRIWPFVARYWPGLLILWGLLKFVDYFRFRTSGNSRPLFSGGEVLLLIFVIFAGSAITTAANLSPGFGRIFEIGDIDLWDITGNNFVFDQHLEEPTARPGSAIDIANVFGDVEVHAADTDRIVVDVRKTIRANDKDEADRLEKEFTFFIRDDGSTYRVISNRDENGYHPTSRQRFKSSLTVQVPKQSSVHLDNKNGRLVIQDLTGSQRVFNRYGDVDVRNVTGRVDIENRNGGVSVQDVTDSVTINNRYSNTTVQNVGGDLQIQTRNGSVDVTGVKGNVVIDNSYAPINVQNVQGELTITGKNNSVDIQHVEGDIRADSSYQNVTIKDPRGAVTVTSRNGDVQLSFVKEPQKDISIDTRYGNVTVELPSGSAFRVDARTEYGEVDSDFDGLSVSRSHRERTITGELRQGGPKVTISLRNGNINLRRA